MLPLHLIAGNDDLRPVFKNIIVKNKYVYVCSGSAIVKLPTNLVFDDIEFSDDEVLLFDAKLWQLLKMPTASIISRDGMAFTNTNMGTVIQAKTPKDLGVNVPDFESVLIPDSFAPTPTTHIGINPKLLLAVVSGLGIKGIDLSDVILQMYGPSRGVEILHPNFKGCRVMVMHCLQDGLEKLDGYKSPASELL